MITVLHILSTLELGGAERFTVGLAKIQREEGLDAQIFNLGTQQDFLVEEVQAQQIPLINRKNGDTRLQHYQHLKRIMKLFDIIHIHSPRTLQHLAFVIPFCSKQRFIYTRHGISPLGSFSWKFLHKFIYRFIDQATFVTQSGRDIFVRYHKWPLEKLQVIENGAYIPESFSISRELPIRFGSVGRMVGLKGQKIVLEAIKNLVTGEKGLGKESIALNFFGSGPLEVELKSSSNDLPENLVKFWGEEQDIDKIYENIDVLIVASRSEGLSMVIIEAMARGIPVIATDVGGNPTLVKDEETGLLITYGNPELLAEAMSTLISETHLIETYGESARELIKLNFSLFNTHLAYLSCYNK